MSLAKDRLFPSISSQLFIQFFKAETIFIGAPTFARMAFDRVTFWRKTLNRLSVRRTIFSKMTFIGMTIIKLT